MSRICDKFQVVVVGVFALLYLFCTNVGDKNLPYLKVMVIDFHYNTLLVFILVLICFLLRQQKVDVIFMLLLFRAFLLIIPIFYNSKPLTYNLGYYITNLNICFLYIAYKNNSRWDKKGMNILILFGIGIVCEVIYTVANLEYNWLYPYYKAFLGIPLGKSNTISCILLPIYLIVDLNLVKFEIKKKVIVQAILGCGLVLTKSRSALLVIVVFYLLKLILNSKRKIDRKRFRIFLVSIGILFIMFLIYSERIIEYLGSFIFGNFNFLTEYSFYNRISSDRGTVVLRVLDDIGTHFLLGNGVDYSRVGNVFAHNVLVDVVYQSGIVGGLLYVSAVIIALKRLYKNTKNHEDMNLLILLPICILLQALMEPGLLLFPVDFIFWLIIGLGNQKELSNVNY